MNRDRKQVLTEWLVLSAQGGNENSFKDLHDLWQGDFRRMVISRIQRVEFADEVANDVWLTIARGLTGLDDPACFPRWAFRILERRCADWIRQRSRARERRQAAANEAERLAPSPPVPAPRDSPDETQRLHEALAGLLPGERQLVELYYGLDRSVAEIAEVLAIPVGTVKSRLFSVREVLKQMLKGKSHE
jgi:RNA polymerase sigma-70 factor (ECF subfamily)